MKSPVQNATQAVLKTGNRVVDPLGVVGKTATESLSLQASDLSTDFEATSAMVNEHVNICPKCKDPMTIALLPAPRQDVQRQNTQKVYFCEQCRVTHPMRS